MTNYDETHAAIMHAIESLTEEQEVAYTAPDVPLPDEYVWTRTIFGRWSVIDKASKVSRTLIPLSKGIGVCRFPGHPRCYNAVTEYILN